jgi:hypothetical protein
MTDRIPLDDMNSDQLDQLYDERGKLQIANRALNTAVLEAVERAEDAEAAIVRVRRLADGGPPSGTVIGGEWESGWDSAMEAVCAALARPAPSAAVESAPCSCSDGYKCPHRCWHCGAARAASCEPWCHIRPFDKPTPAAIEATEDPIIRERAHSDDYDEQADHSYQDMLNTPLPPATVAALRERLAADLGEQPDEAAASIANRTVEINRLTEEVGQQRERADQAEAERDGAYRERARLEALVAGVAEQAVIAPAPDVDEPGWQILYATLHGRQCSWHIAPRDADLFEHLEHVLADDPRAQWDGHTTDEKYQHIDWLAHVLGTPGPFKAHTYLPTDRLHGDQPAPSAATQATGGSCSVAAPETEPNNQGQPLGGVLPPGTGATEEHPAITTGLVVQPYRNDRGDPAWVFRCWGTDTCDGWLSLDHYSRQSAERARDRHVAEEHTDA